MRWGVLLALALALVEALPVKEKRPEEHKEEQQHKEGEEQSEDWELNLEYGRYLKEVVQALESDPSFRKKLETAEVDDIKSGKIARELHFVDHNVRTKLDELKRRELERLRHLAVREHEKQTGVDRNLLKVPVHIDHKNPTRFEVEDLKKLIMKTTEDLEKVDEQRRTEFKTYELEKEFERQQELSALDESHRKTAETQHQDEVKKHKQHSKLHHPGSKQQLEEVWEEQDHMQPEDFDPKTFFHLHDLDGNGFWDEIEVKALFKKELDKMYDPNASEDDINERYEEMERMREHVFKESDIDKDNLISFREFVDQTKRAEFEQDGGWQGLDEQEIYSQHEYEEYERQRQEEIRRLVEAGAIPPPPGYHGLPPAQPAIYQAGGHPGSYAAAPQGLSPPHAVPQHGQPPQVHPNAVPQGYQAAPQGYQAVPQGYQAVPQGYQAVPQGYQAVPQGYQAIPQGYQQVQFAPQGVPYQQVPAQPGQHPQGQVQQGQPSAGQVQQGQPPQGNIQGQPPQGQVVQGQPPQGHLPQGQVAQGQPAQGQVVNVQPAQGQVVQGQFVQGQVPQGQGVQGQPAQGQVLQGQPPQGQVVQGQPPQGQVPAVGQVGQNPPPVAGNNVGGQPRAGK
ncbi:nucleobindin-2-like isoform X1 [Homarus americanus]|uniref:nucleobindin-2-like isoform X1 n=1 Tax=Homarus americanus TaxID=6706 RepID=UPI001C43C72E|nr:nucleobindin-2-like isoform X1 [Homarus americanus]XP_042231035.1 nucleobindin-2-like isoform X1 [Homarus americanus]